MIIGIGTDIIEIERIKKVLNKSSKEQFIKRILNQTEINLYQSKMDSFGIEQLAIFIAGRWALKEAISKSLGCGIGEYCSFHDITISNELKGRPVADLTGNAKNYCQNLIDSKMEANASNQSNDDNKEFNIFVSISHEKNYATAIAVIENI